MITQSLKQWQEEGEQRFGEGENWAFVCPVCGHVATVSDFIALGQTADDAAQVCIGRINGHMKPHAKAGDNSNGCDWCAFGLLGTIGRGRNITFPDGSSCEVFDFAEGSEMA